MPASHSHTHSGAAAGADPGEYVHGPIVDRTEGTRLGRRTDEEVRHPRILRRGMLFLILFLICSI